MGVCLGNVFALSEQDKVLPVVPMFHANAWGLPYAAVLAGADLIMPDRFLQPEPLVRLIEAERPTLAGAVPTIWNVLLAHVRGARRRPVLAAAGAVRRLGGAARAAGGLREGTRRPDRAGLGDDGDLAARQRGAPAAPARPSEEAWRYRDTQGRLMCAVEGGWSATAAPCCRTTARPSARWRSAGRG